jgi:PPOX class probable FMN-dependent enzyme
MSITTIAELRGLYPAPTERAIKKRLTRLDHHCRRFIAHAPFVVMASGAAEGGLDASPRGGAPGFVKVTDDHTLLLPDDPGNNRLDTLENIVETGRVGLLFLVPGVDETLRINGAALLSQDPAHLDHCHGERRRPRLVVVVTVAEAYLHCAKALMRAALWDPGSTIDRSRLPTMGEMIAEQIGGDAPPETQEAMLRRYASEL